MRRNLGRVLILSLAAWTFGVACEDETPTDASTPDAAADGGDAGSSDSGLLSCEESDLALGEALRRLWSDPNACDVDADCRLADVLFMCPSGARFTFCPLSIHVDSTAGLDAAIEQALAEKCGRIPADCVGGAQCAETRAICRSGACASELVAP